MPYYCTVPRCTSMAGKAKNVSFHQFPRDEELAKLWNKILKRGKPYTKYSKVCSLHFTAEDYTITSVGKNKGQWRTLRKDAIPSQNLPSESPTPYQRKQWGSWTNNAQANVLDPTIQQQVAQAIYMQTMLAMQAAGSNENPALNNCNGVPLQQATTEAQSSHRSDEGILSGKQTNTHASNSYKCTECSRCFKDPDVFILHKRSHEKNEKENFNLNVTLQANPILANLLKTNTENSNIFDNNFLSIESLLMTALAANMEGYMRNYTSVAKEDDRGTLNNDRDSSGHDKGGFIHDRDGLDHDRGSFDRDRIESSSREYFENSESVSQNDGINCDRNSDRDRGSLNRDSPNSNHDSESVSMVNSDSNLIRDRLIQLYRNNDAYDSVRNVRYFEKDSENNSRSSQDGDVTNNDDRNLMSQNRGMLDCDSNMMDHDRSMMDHDRGIMDHDRSIVNRDKGSNDDKVTNDDDNSQGSDGAICDSDFNESIDSNKLVIDENL